MVVIYLDSFMAASFWIHLLSLWLTGYVVGAEYIEKKKRRVAGALFGTGVDVVVLVLLFEKITGFTPGYMGIGFVQLLLSAWISFGRRKLLQNTMVLLVITVLFSGVFQMIPGGNAGLYCLVGCFVFPLVKKGAESFFRAKQTNCALYEVCLIYQGEEQKFTALMDTGNRLRLPGSRIPVVLAEEDCLSKWMENAKEHSPEKLVFVPYKGVGGKGLLYGIRVRYRICPETGNHVKASQTEICHAETRPTEIRSAEGEVAVVAAEHRLFEGCEYRMILQPEVLR